MSSDPIDNNPNLPPWLRGLPLPPRPAAPSAPAGAAPADAQAATALPEWLRDLGHDQPAETVQLEALPEPLPDWLSSLPEPAQPSAQAEPLPDWLRDLNEPAGAAPAPEASDAADVPDWLRETQRAAPAPEPAPTRDADAPPASPEPADTLPSWLLGEPDTADVPPAAPAADTGLPSWLGEPDTADAPPAAPAADTGLPSWLSPNDTPNSPATPAADTDLPSWLGEPDTADAPPAAPAADTDLPSWLAGQQDQPDEGAAIAPFSFDEPGGASPRSEASWLANDIGTTGEAMPDWLSAPAPDEPAATPDQPLWMNDRGPRQPPVEPPAAPQAPGAQAGDLPDWLRDASANQPPTQSPEIPQAPGAQAGDLPDWLRDASANQPPAPPAAPAAPEAASASAESMPDWLTTPAAPSPGAEELPSWLSDTVSAPPTPASSDELPSWMSTPARSDAPAEPAEQPSWMSEPVRSEEATTPAWLTPEQSEPAERSAPPPAEGEELPAWLRAMPADAPASPAAPSAPASKSAEELPPWLSDEHGQPLPTAGAPGDANLPTWLRGANAGPPAPLAEPATPSQPAAPAQPPRAKTPTTELVGGIELPVWLRPTETEAPKEISPTDARALDWLTRLGPTDDEPESAPAQPQKLTPPALPARSSAQLSAIALLEQLAADPFAEPAAEPAAAAPPAWRWLRPELLLYVALLAALIVALATPTSALLGLNSPPSMPSADALFKQIDTLAADDIVLVGYEWDARRSSELRPLERAVLDHLIEHNVKLVLVSTDSQGSLLLYDMRDRLEQAGYQPRGEDYILLGYKPGAELALRTIAQSFPSTLRSDFQGNDASGSILATDANRQPRLRSIADFSMVLVLADDASDVQGWMEQVHPSARRATGGFVPFGFLMPAETTPIVQPYLSQPNVAHLDGRQGALAYQQLRGGSGLPAAQVAAEAGQQRLSVLAYLALLLIGGIVVGVYSAATRGRKRS